MAETKRERYWRDVAAELNGPGIRKRDGSDLDWETIEVSAESRGFLRTNITKPIDMANNGMRNAFYPMEF